MQRSTKLTAVAVSAGLAVIGLTSAHADTADQATGPLTIKVREGITEVERIDVNGDGSSDGIGDESVFTGPLLKAGKVVGHETGICTLTTTGGQMQCVYTARFPKGEIAVQGVANRDDLALELAVTGGTGRFRNVSGSMLIDYAGMDDFTFKLNLNN